MDGTKAHKNEGNIDTKATVLLLSLLLLLLLLLRVMVREGTDDDAKITKISKCTAHQKKQKHNSPVNSLPHEARTFNN